MLICESYLLIYLERWKDRDTITITNPAGVCLVGAGIMDLILRGKLMIEGKKLITHDTSPTGIAFLDEILTMIKDSKKIRKLNRWVIGISGYHSLQRYNLIFQNLERQGIIKFQQIVSGRIFIKWKYEFTNPEVISSLLERIEKVFIETIDPEIELFCLLNLLRISRLFKISVSEEYRKTAKFRMEQLLQAGDYDPNHLEMIVKIKKAYRAAERDRYQSIV